MRRLLGFVLMASVLRVTTFDVQTECERHAADAAPVAASETGHEHHAAVDLTPATHQHESDAPANDAEAPLPKCCVLTSTCGGSAIDASGASRAAVASTSSATCVPALRAPRATIQAPEPPPPKA